MKSRSYNHTLFLEYQATGEVCFYCKEKTHYDHITIDHVFPRNRGFTLFNNRVYACRFCNNIKKAFSVYQFREQLCNLFRVHLKKHPNSIMCNRILIAIKTCTELINDKESILWSEKVKRCPKKLKPYLPKEEDIYRVYRKKQLIHEELFLR